MTAQDGTLDKSLIARFRGGDEAAFQLLCRRYEARLRSRVRRLLTPAVLRKMSTSDVLQEAYVAAIERFIDFEDRGEGSFGRWLGRIVENKALHAARRFQGTVKRGAVAELSRGKRPETAQFVGRVPSPSQAAMASELRTRVRGAVQQLPDDYRDVIRLRQEEHLTVRETAERMHRSPAAVKMLYGRAVTRLAELLDLSEET